MISGLDKQVLQPLDGIHFDEEAHAYSYNGQWMRGSVSTILSWDLSDEARANIEATKDVWAARGTTVHLALEQHLLGAASINPGEYAEWVDPLLSCWLWEGSKTLACEHRMVNPKRKIGGSFDFLIERKNKTGEIVRCLGDLKTVQTTEAVKRRKPAKAQLGAYLEMMAIHHREIWIDHCLTVVSGPGLCKVITSTPDECSSAWLDAWDRYQAGMKLLPF